MPLCKKCFGAGYLQKDDGYMGMPEAIPCSCTIKKALNQQAEKAWQGLSEYPIKKTSLLRNKIKENLIVVSDRNNLMSHLRSALAHERRPERFIKVVSDATLMSAWLSNLQLANSEIIDPDFQRDIRVQALEDLAESPFLLIIRIGIKMARNSAMPEVLVETIELRQHLGKPTWIIEEPNRPLVEGHICWSRAVDESLENWEKVNLIGTSTTKTKKPKGVRL